MLRKHLRYIYTLYIYITLKPAVWNLFLPSLLVRVITQTLSACLRRHRLHHTPCCCSLLRPPSALVNQILLVDIKRITTSVPVQESCHRLQIWKLWYTAKYKEIYQVVIGLINIVQTCLARPCVKVRYCRSNIPKLSDEIWPISGVTR